MRRRSRRRTIQLHHQQDGRYVLTARVPIYRPEQTAPWPVGSIRFTSMHSCFFRFGSPRRRQALHSGGGVTVVSRGGEGVRAKIVVRRGELERIAAGVTRRQCSRAGVAPSRRHIVVTAVSLEGRLALRGAAATGGPRWTAYQRKRRAPSSLRLQGASEQRPARRERVGVVIPLRRIITRRN